MESGLAQVGASQVGFFPIDLCQAGCTKAGAAEVCTRHLRSGQQRVTEISFCERSARQEHSLQIATGKPRALKSGTGELRAEQG